MTTTELRGATIAGLVLLLLASALPVFPVAEASLVFNIRPTSQDAGLSFDFPDTNFGSSNNLAVGRFGATDVRRGLVQYDVSTILPTTVLTLGRICLFFLAESFSHVVEIHKVEASWVEGTVTWNNQPLFNAAIEGSLTVTSSSGYRCFTTTTMIQGWIDGTVPNYGAIAVHPTETVTEHRSFATKERFISQEPYLELTVEVLDEVHVSYFNTFTGQGIAFETFKLFMDTGSPPTTRRFSPTFSLEDGVLQNFEVQDFFNVTIASGTFTPSSDPDFLDISLPITDFFVQFSDNREHRHRFKETVSSATRDAFGTPTPLFADNSYTLEVFADDFIFAIAETALPDITGATQVHRVTVSEKNATVHVSYFNTFTGDGIPFERYKLFLDTNPTPTTRRVFPTFNLDNTTAHNFLVQDFFNVTIASGTFTPDSNPDFLDISLPITDFFVRFSDRRDHLMRFTETVSSATWDAYGSPTHLFATNTYTFEVFDDDFIFPVAAFTLPDITGAVQVYNQSVAPKDLDELYLNQTRDMTVPDFDAVNDQITTTISSFPAAAASWGGWFRFDAFGGDRVVLNFGNFPSEDGSATLFFRNSDQTVICGKSTPDTRTGSTTVLVTDTWYLLYCTWDGSTLTVSVNGTQENSASIAGTSIVASFVVGGVSGARHNGPATNAQVYTQALSQADRSALWARGLQGFPLESRGNVLHLPMVEIWSGLAHDYGPNADHGTLVGGLTFIIVQAPLRSTVFFAFFDGNEPHAKQDWRLFWGVDRVADRRATGYVGATTNFTVRDFYNNLITSGNHTVADWPQDFVDIQLTTFNWKLTNKDLHDYILTDLTFNGSGIERSQFVTPVETIDYWLLNGDYTLNLTFFDGGVVEEMTQIFFTIASAAQALTVADDHSVQRLTGDIDNVGDNVLENWDKTNKTFVRVNQLDTPAGLAIVYDTYYIPPTNMLDLLSKDVVPGLTIDPFRTLIYNILNTSEGTGRLTLNKPFDTGLDEDDVTMMQDDLHVVVISGSLTRWWLNDTKDTATTSDDTIVLNITYVGFFDLTQYGDGLNLSVETEGTASLNLTRVSQVRFVSTFLWTQDTVTRQFLMTTSLENTLALPLSNVNLYIAFPQTVEADPSTVIVRDVTASVDLEKGIHYDLTDGGVYLALTTLASNEIKTWRITFFEHVEGTSILEPRCSFGRVSQQRRGLVDMQRVEVACVNENVFDYRGRIVLVFDPSRAVRHDSIIVEDLSGNILSRTAYWNDRDTLILTGVAVDSLETLQLVVWFRYTSDVFAVTDLLPWLPIIGVVFAAFAIIAYFAWSRQPKGSGRQERARVATILFGILAVITFVLLVYLQIAQGI